MRKIFWCCAMSRPDGRRVETTVIVAVRHACAHSLQSYTGRVSGRGCDLLWLTFVFYFLFCMYAMYNVVWGRSFPEELRGECMMCTPVVVTLALSRLDDAWRRFIIFIPRGACDPHAYRCFFLIVVDACPDTQRVSRGLLGINIFCSARLIVPNRIPHEALSRLLCQGLRVQPYGEVDRRILT